MAEEPYAPGREVKRISSAKTLSIGSPDALNNHDPELGKMRLERVCQHRLLPDRQRDCAMQHEDSLLASAFDRHTYPPDGETRAWWGRLKRGYTYLSLQTGIEASAALGVTVNMINTATNYQSAAELHFEGALNEHFPFGLAAGARRGYWVIAKLCIHGRNAGSDSQRPMVS